MNGSPRRAGSVLERRRRCRGRAASGRGSGARAPLPTSRVAPPPAPRTRRCRGRRRDTRPRRRRGRRARARIRSGMTLIRPGCTSISPTVPTVPCPAARASRSSSRIDSATGRPGSRRKSIGVAPAWSPRPCTMQVGVDVAGDRRHDAHAVARVLEHPCLLDVHLDPAGEVVEDVDRLAPARRLRSPPPRACSQKLRPSSRARKRSRRSSSVTRWAMIRLPSSICPKPEPSSSRNEISCSGRPRPSSSSRRHTSSAVTTPSVPSYLPPLRLESQCEPTPNAFSPVGPVARDERADGILADLEAECLELAGEVVERVAVDRRVRVAADRLVGERVVRARRASRRRARSAPRCAPGRSRRSRHSV